MNKSRMLEIIKENDILAREKIEANRALLPELLYEGKKNRDDFINETLTSLSKTNNDLVEAIDIWYDVSEKEWINKVATAYMGSVYLTSADHHNTSTRPFKGATESLKKEIVENKVGGGSSNSIDDFLNKRRNQNKGNG